MNTILAHAMNPEVRRMASSGGLVKTLLAWLVESGRVDAAVIVRSGDDERFHPEAMTTDDPGETLSPLTNSVYHPVPVREVLAGLDPSRRYAATLLPCDAAWLAARRDVGQILSVDFVVSLLCNCTPAASFTTEILGRLGVDPSELSSLRYRGDGWPGKVSICHAGKSSQIEFTKAWGLVERHVPLRCRRCPWLGVPPCDVMVADPWGMRGVGPGKTVARLVTDRGHEVISNCLAAGLIEAENVAEEVFDRLLATTAAAKRRRKRDADQ